MTRHPLAERGLHVAVLWSLAVAQPLFDVLEDNPEFFASRGASPGRIVAAAVLVILAGPAVVLAAEWLVGLASERAAWALHVTVVGALAAAIGLVVANAVLALIAGALAALAYARWPAVRTALTVLGPAPLVFLALFLLVSDVSEQVFPGADVQASPVKARAPIVLVIFDELPVHSLMNAEGHVDSVRYPNFARLAAGATWYRNTASVEQDTPYAVPAILDARYPRRDHLPVAADHPQNVFSLLGRSYQLHVREEATAMCPASLCRAEPRPFWGDLARLYGHRVLPGEVSSPLRSVDSAIADTANVPRESKRHRYVRLHRNLGSGRPQRFEQFVAGIEGGSRPRLHLVHVLLPHVPFVYLPSGRSYRPPGTGSLDIDERPGYAVPFLVHQAYQRHLLQLEFADRLLGRLLGRLREVGIYKRALIAVVADHGVSFRLGHDRRLLRPGNIQDIAPVPFFLKAPGQQRGRISDKPLQTIDVLPTMMDVLDVRIPWKVDGRSALRPGVPHPRREMVSKKFKHTYLVDTPSFEPRKQAALARKVRLFGDEHDDIYAFGPRPDLIGSRAPGGGRVVELKRGSAYVPTRVAGTIDGEGVVEVAVNGRVVATGLTFELEDDDRERYSVMIPERSLHPGPNRIAVRLVR